MFRERLKMSETIDDMFAYAQLEDSIFLRILNSPEPELEPARKILQDIQSRRLYKFIGQTKRKPGAEDKVFD
jgi:deoxynucleoside triphosphate triphosphohydrolase SAMHD1